MGQLPLSRVQSHIGKDAVGHDFWGCYGQTFSDRVFCAELSQNMIQHYINAHVTLKINNFHNAISKIVECVFQCSHYCRTDCEEGNYSCYYHVPTFCQLGTLEKNFVDNLVKPNHSEIILTKW